jgi:ubiquinone/menaquinone biosynthesis C-methylase UbiE
MPVGFTTIDPNVALLLELGPADELLDVACGAGVFLARHAGQARSIAGLDASELQIVRARRRHRHRIAAGTAVFVQGEATTLPWADASFTAVSCNCVDCLSEPHRALEEMRRVLRPGGRAVVALQRSRREVDAATPDLDSWDLPRHTRAAAEAMLTEAGFVDVVVVGNRSAWFVRGRRV